MKTLRTERLTLRPFTLDDAPAVQKHCSAYEVALNTLLIPHPYPDGAAELRISSHADDYAQTRIHHFALDDGELAGAMGLVMKGDRIAELGYWIGVPFWNRGYATEAARVGRLPRRRVLRHPAGRTQQPPMTSSAVLPTS
jgi:[ribosomal protein S5]-alanine N-acetyltransferase